MAATCLVLVVVFLPNMGLTQHFPHSVSTPNTGPSTNNEGINLADSFFIRSLRQGDPNALNDFSQLRHSITSPMELLRSFRNLGSSRNPLFNMFNIWHTMAIARGLIPNSVAPFAPPQLDSVQSINPQNVNVVTSQRPVPPSVSNSTDAFNQIAINNNTRETQSVTNIPRAGFNNANDRVIDAINQVTLSSVASRSTEPLTNLRIGGTNFRNRFRNNVPININDREEKKPLIPFVTGIPIGTQRAIVDTSNTTTIDVRLNHGFVSNQVTTEDSLKPVTVRPVTREGIPINMDLFNRVTMQPNSNVPIDNERQQQTTSTPVATTLIEDSLRADVNNGDTTRSQTTSEAVDRVNAQHGLSSGQREERIAATVPTFNISSTPISMSGSSNVPFTSASILTDNVNRDNILASSGQMLMIQSSTTSRIFPNITDRNIPFTGLVQTQNGISTASDGGGASSNESVRVDSSHILRNLTMVAAIENDGSDTGSSRSQSQGTVTTNLSPGIVNSTQNNIIDMQVTADTINIPVYDFVLQSVDDIVTKHGTVPQNHSNMYVGEVLQSLGIQERGFLPVLTERFHPRAERGRPKVQRQRVGSGKGVVVKYVGDLTLRKGDDVTLQYIGDVVTEDGVSNVLLPINVTIAGNTTGTNITATDDTQGVRGSTPTGRTSMSTMLQGLSTTISPPNIDTLSKVDQTNTNDRTDVRPSIELPREVTLENNRHPLERGVFLGLTDGGQLKLIHDISGFLGFQGVNVHAVDLTSSKLELPVVLMKLLRNYRLDETGEGQRDEVTPDPGVSVSTTGSREAPRPSGSRRIEEPLDLSDERLFRNWLGDRASNGDSNVNGSDRGNETIKTIDGKQIKVLNALFG